MEHSSDGKTIVISSDSHNGDGTDRGRVKVYQLLNDDSSWTQLGGNIDGIADNDYFGYSLSISSDANIIAVGADYVDNSGNTNIGAVYVKKYTSLGWVDHGSIILGETAGDTFGGSVSLSRDGNIRRRFK